MTRLLVNWIAVVIAVYLTTTLQHDSSLVAQLLPPSQFGYTTFQGLAIFALVLGLLNEFVAPIIKFLTFPLTLLTLGLFSLVVNAAMFLLASTVSGTVHVGDFYVALVAAIIVSIVNVVVRRLIK